MRMGRFAHRPPVTFAFAFALVAACANDDASALSTFTPGETMNETEPPTVDEPPKGVCSDEGAERIVQTPAGLEACRSGEADAHVAASPNTWRCRCTGGEWRCEITHCGFGLMTCP